jgi:uncharacterized protein
MKGKQGLASMSPERRHAIARLGGQTSQARKVGHAWTAAEAAAAGRKSGQARRLKAA